jgi:hypothetical protein
VESLEGRSTPAVVNLTPTADNTLYAVATADPAQQLSNGAGQRLYVGAAGPNSTGIRRGAIRFDLSAVPAGSTITDVTLTLSMTRTISGAQDVALRRALMSWGEGTSNAGAGGVGPGGGDGVPATPGDATWFFSSFATQQWATPGGDFASAASASTSVSNLGNYQWTGAGLTADVQQWLNNPATNFGWILTGNEAAASTAKEFATKENANAAIRPVLAVNFNTPLPTAAAVVNDGAVQRSMVTRLTVNFSTIVTVDPGAFTLQRVGGAAITLNQSVSTIDGKTVAVLTFTGTGVTAGSLDDGNYTLTVSSDKVRDSSGNALDGDVNGVAGGDYTLSLHRFYGDVTGDRFVNGADFALFRTAFGTGLGDPNYNAAFDLNGDGFVNGLDFAVFRNNFGKSI